MNAISLTDVSARVQTVYGVLIALSAACAAFNAAAVPPPSAMHHVRRGHGHCRHVVACGIFAVVFYVLGLT
jgi:hypothetical protein